MSNGFENDSAGTAIYYKHGSKVELLQNPHTDHPKLKSRILMARINNVWYGELYSPTSNASVEQRTDFYAYASEAITMMRQKDDTIPMILMGDFNAHITGHYSTSTDGNGKLL